MAIKKSKVKAYKGGITPTPTAMRVGGGLKKSSVTVVSSGGMGKSTAVPIQPLMAPSSVYTSGITPTPTAMGVDSMAGQNAALEKQAQKPMDSYFPGMENFKQEASGGVVANSFKEKKKKSKVTPRFNNPKEKRIDDIHPYFSPRENK